MRSETFHTAGTACNTVTCMNIFLRKGLTLGAALALAFAVNLHADRISDEHGLISMEAPEGWISVPVGAVRSTVGDLPNSNLFLLGFKSSESGLFFMKQSGAVDIIPHLQISVYDVRGLALNDDVVRALESDLPARYSAEMGETFKLLVLEKVTIAGLRAARLTGIYRWRTVNIKVLQYLIPGSDHLYEITYTALERTFSRNVIEVEEALDSIQISDPPLLLDWLWDLLRWGILLGIVVVIIGAIFFATGSQPGRLTSRFSDRSTAGNPFLKK